MLELKGRGGQEQADTVIHAEFGSTFWGFQCTSTDPQGSSVNLITGKKIRKFCRLWCFHDSLQNFVAKIIVKQVV